MSKPILSKSTYIRSLQCLKSLYLYKNYYNKRDIVSPEQQAKFNRGHAVGKLAQQLFPGGIDAGKGVRQRSKDALLKTMELISSGVKVIYEASFQYDDVWVILDILVKEDTGWKAYEVKSSSALSDTYMQDAALQHYVVNSALPQITNEQLKGFALIYVNKNYVLQGSFDIKKYFLVSEIKNWCEEQTEFVKGKVLKAKLTLDYGKIPAIDTGEHCFNPYPCDFMGTCFKTNKQEKTISANSAEINSLINSHQDKLYVLEFFYSRPAVPLYNGTVPYQYIIFLSGLTTFTNDEANDAYFVIEDTNTNPTPAFLKHLISITASPGIVLVDDYENKCRALTNSAEHFPEFAASISVLVQRLKPMTDFFIVNNNEKASIDQIYDFLNIQPVINTGVMKNRVEAADAFEQLHEVNDLFKNMEITEAMNAFCKHQLHKMVSIINEMKRYTEKPVL